MRSLLCFGGLCVVALLAHHATRPVQQYTTLVGTMGNDTVAVDRFTRNETTLEGVLLVRSPRTHTLQYKAVLAAGGRFSHLDMVWRDAAGAEMRSAGITFGVDSIRSKLQGPSEQSFSAPPMLEAIPLPPRPYAYQSYSLLESAAMVVVMTKPPGAVPLKWIVTGATRSVDRRARRVAGDTLEIEFLDGPLHARADRDGHLVWLSGTLGGRTLVVQRSASDVDLPALTASFARRDRESTMPGRTLPHS